MLRTAPFCMVFLMDSILSPDAQSDKLMTTKSVILVSLLSPITSKPASLGRIKTSHPEVIYSHQVFHASKVLFLVACRDRPTVPGDLGGIFCSCPIQRIGQSGPSNPEEPSKPNGKRNTNEGYVQPSRARISLFWMPENL